MRTNIFAVCLSLYVVVIVTIKMFLLFYSTMLFFNSTFPHIQISFQLLDIHFS
jgi:hypothetical protein